MGSKASKSKRPTLTETKRAIIPRIPQDTIPIPPQDGAPTPPRDTIPIIPHDIINEIFDHLASDSDFQSLRTCALVSRSWHQPCQRHLFHTAVFTPTSARKWLEMFPVREESPACHVRDLRLRIGEAARIPEKFYECIPWFTDVDRMTFSGHVGVPLGYGGYSSSPAPSLWQLPRSVTSLTINTGVVTLVQVRDIMAQLPNLDDLAFLDSLAEVDRRKLPGIGTVLKGRFGGRLMLRDADEDVVNMLLEIPSGLHFVELEIYCTHNRLPSSAIRLAEACRKTLVKLSHTAGYHCKSYPFSYSGWF